MKELFRKITTSSIIMSILLILLGLILVIYPNISLASFAIVAGIYLIIEGFHLIYQDVTSRFVLIPVDGLLPGILSIIFGFMFLARPEVMQSVITLIVGVWIIVKSCNSIKLALSLKDVKESDYVLLLVLSILEIILGIIVLVNPEIASISIVSFIGLMLIIYSIINIVEMIMFNRDVKDFEKIIKK